MLIPGVGSSIWLWSLLSWHVWQQWILVCPCASDHGGEGGGGGGNFHLWCQNMLCCLLGCFFLTFPLEGYFECPDVCFWACFWWFPIIWMLWQAQITIRSNCKISLSWNHPFTIFLGQCPTPSSLLPILPAPHPPISYHFAPSLFPTLLTPSSLTFFFFYPSSYFSSALPTPPPLPPIVSPPCKYLILTGSICFTPGPFACYWRRNEIGRWYDIFGVRYRLIKENWVGDISYDVISANPAHVISSLSDNVCGSSVTEMVVRRTSLQMSKSGIRPARIFKDCFSKCWLRLNICRSVGPI